MILVFDQMRPDYIDRFGLENFKRFRGSSRNYPEAYVGHLGSQTVVSHLVISTGLLPKWLPWQDDAIFDEKGPLENPARPMKQQRSRARNSGGFSPRFRWSSSCLRGFATN